MQITRQTDYAVRCVLYLSGFPDNVVMVDEIAKAKAIPKSFLSKILQKLAKVNIVKSYRGVKGGFKLARKPKDISLLDVIEAIEPIAMNKCAVNQRICSFSVTCSVHPVWVELRKDVKERMRRYTFAKLIAQKISI